MKLNKDITFIYMDSAEKSMFVPLYEEAKNRGYSVKMTQNKFEKCEIGFYCQHINFPQYSKFSIIMLHDIIQQYGNWPDIWFREPWDKYDVGILPSDQWVKNWNQCSQYYYTRPRLGMYQVGWPKADSVAAIQQNSYREEFFEKYHLDPQKRTILYAPAWENDGKQDDFVKAMLPLNVNILIKQYDADPNIYPETVRNIHAMYELHKDIPGVTILPPETNIFHAIAVSDVLVSEESSTMAEAVMMGVPAVSVSNWLIPDVTPSRYPECSYDFVVLTKKEKLSECIKDIVDNYAKYRKETQAASAKNFSNIGKVASMIMDIVDDCVANDEIRYSPIIPNKKEAVAFMKNVKHWFLRFKIAMYSNYSERYRFVSVIWSTVKKMKQFIAR